MSMLARVCRGWKVWAVRWCTQDDGEGLERSDIAGRGLLIDMLEIYESLVKL